MDWWTTIAAVGAVAVAGWAALSRALDSSLTVRQHEEYKESVSNRIDAVEAQMRRDDDRLEDRIKVLEATRPTTGELEARLGRTNG